MFPLDYIEVTQRPSLSLRGDNAGSGSGEGGGILGPQLMGWRRERALAERILWPTDSFSCSAGEGVLKVTQRQEGTAQTRQGGLRPGNSNREEA